MEIPEKVAVKADKLIKISGPQGETEKRLVHPGIKIFVENGKILLESKKATQKEKRVLNAFAAHLKNMLKGVKEKHVYKLKVCSGHFPMNVSVTNNQLVIKNFLGESVPRKVNIRPNVVVKVEGVEIIISSPSKESAGQMAADIEEITKVKNRDVRIFQDGCHITHKAGKDM